MNGNYMTTEGLGRGTAFPLVKILRLPARLHLPNDLVYVTPYDYQESDPRNICDKHFATPR